MRRRSGNSSVCALASWQAGLRMSAVLPGPGQTLSLLLLTYWGCAFPPLVLFLTSSASRPNSWPLFRPLGPSSSPVWARTRSGTELLVGLPTPAAFDNIACDILPHAPVYALST